MSSSLRLLVLTALLLLAAVTASGCAAGGAYTAAADTVSGRAVRVATTTNFITDTVERIGGDRVAVEGLMGPGVDPHLYKASARDVKTLRDADVVLYGGLELEGKMGDVFEELGERQTTVAVTGGIPRSALLLPPPGAAPGEQFDPHVWFDVSLWEHAAREVAETLGAKDPAGAATYRANLAAYVRELRAADREIRARIARIPEQRRVLVTSHDAFAYFGRRYGMEVAAIQGISTAAEATTADVQRVARLIADRDVRTIFLESSVPRQTIDAVLAAARRRGSTAVVGTELFTDAAGDRGTPEGTYLGMVRANARAIEVGLS
ncbi:MAG: periplasmic solute binding protein [Solirubrobacterales bacterium]|jgi:manganese/zinc/iron transport system substrate-binding protein|nr:periplasmic solute binding protein [Solirubrobacterales bacterium]